MFDTAMAMEMSSLVREYAVRNRLLTSWLFISWRGRGSENASLVYRTSCGSAQIRPQSFRLAAPASRIQAIANPNDDLLQALRPAGSAQLSESPERLFAMAYDELRRIASQQRRHVGESLTLNTTALVHEVYLKLSPHPDGWNRAHFLALTARAMRQVLIDHARSRVCLKRGGQIVFTEADENHADASGDMADMLALDQSLTALAALDARAGQVVEWYVFGGLSLEEIAKLQGVTERTAYRDWRRARAFLVQRLGLTVAASEK